MWLLVLELLILGKGKRRLDLQQPRDHEASQSTREALKQTENEIDFFSIIIFNVIRSIPDAIVVTLSLFNPPKFVTNSLKNSPALGAGMEGVESIRDGFFESLIHAKQALINIEFKNQLWILLHKFVVWEAS